MSPDSPWVTFWKVVLTVGLTSFFLLVMVVIPFGARDIMRLFKKLDAARKQEEEPPVVNNGLKT